MRVDDVRERKANAIAELFAQLACRLEVALERRSGIRAKLQHDKVLLSEQCAEPHERRRLLHRWQRKLWGGAARGHAEAIVVPTRDRVVARSPAHGRVWCANVDMVRGRKAVVGWAASSA